MIPFSSAIHFEYLDFFRSKLKVRSRFWISEEKIQQYFQSINLFFIIAMGRSGTMFLSKLLNRADDAIVFHEPVSSDKIAFFNAFFRDKDALKYIRDYRKKEIYLRVRDLPIKCYGEVNSFLRRHCVALQKFFDRATILHLIRDGRDTVRSIMNKQTFTPQDFFYNKVAPHSDDPYYDKWHQMNRFDRVCWYWKVENEYLRKNTKSTIKFELLCSDYDYFVESVLQPLALEIPFTVWKEAIKRRVNPSKNYDFPRWSEWERSKKEKFVSICGDEMVANGYEL